MIRLNISLILIILTFTCCQNTYLNHTDPSQITAQELREHISFLAADSLQGRKAGTPEGRMAAKYIRDQLKESNITLLGDNGFQYFDVVTSVNAGENNEFTFPGFHGKVLTDFTPLAFSENATLEAPVQFVGYGFNIKTDSLTWQDYQDTDITGKWALILNGHPELDKPQSVFDEYSELRQKVMIAKDEGASGVLFVSGSNFDKQDELLPLTFDKSQATAGIPVLHIKRNVADSLLKPSPVTIDSLESRLNRNRQPVHIDIAEKVMASAEIIKQTAPTQNVVAVIHGTDPVLKDEYIIIGAHYDHLGLGGPGSGSRRPDTTAIHNGADDNASGVAGILEIMEKLAANKEKLKRSILFISFGAEEMGTLGSKYFINNPLIDMQQVQLMVNFDMIGMLNDESKALTIMGTGTALELPGVVKKYSENYPLSISESAEGFGPSDHAPFYAESIPVIMFFTGAHDYYHTPEDDVEHINFKGEKNIADFAYDMVCDIANRTETLTFQEAGPASRPRRRLRFKVTLGIVPDHAAQNINGLRVDLVIKGRPAYQAGMKKGDIITALEGKTVSNIYDYMYRLKELQPGQRISVEVLRDGEKKILIVEL